MRSGGRREMSPAFLYFCPRIFTFIRDVRYFFSIVYVLLAIFSHFYQQYVRKTIGYFMFCV